MQLASTTIGFLADLVLKDIAYSENFSSKIFPSFMLKAHYNILLSWLFEHSEELQLHKQTQFRAKQILDIFLSDVGDLHSHSYQLAAAVCIGIAIKSVEHKDYPTTQLIHNTGDQYSPEQVNIMESHIMAEVVTKLDGLHSPYFYCSDEIVMHLLMLKLTEAFSLMVPFVSTHANSFGINSFSVFLAIIKRLAASQSSEQAVMAQLNSSLSQSVMLDCDKISEILQELSQFNEGLSDAHPLK